MKAYNFRHILKTFRLLLMYYEVIITQNMLILSVKLYFFLIKMQILLLFLLLVFFFLNVKCVESARQKDLTDVMSFQLHVDIDIKDILIHFPL